MSVLGKKYIAALVGEGDVKNLTAAGSIEHLFKASEIDLFSFVMNHVKSYHTLPKEETIHLHLELELPVYEEPPDYYLDLLKLRHTEHELKKAMQQASDFLLPDNKDPEAAMEAIASSVMELMTQKHQNVILDFREAYDLIVGDYVAKYTAEDGYGINLGWPTLDEMTGGLFKGDMVSIAGRIGKGKTWQLLYAAHHAWHVQKRRVMFVSMEMKPLPIEHRIISMHASIPHDKIKNAELSSHYLDKMKKSLTEIKSEDAPFWVIDGNFSATVEEIWMLARQLNPDAIYIDGGYLLKHPTERDRYRRVAENADLIKQELSDRAPTTCSWQFAREAAKKSKKKTGDPVGLEDIGYSDAIGQASSLVLGLFEQESVETIKQRRVEILKGRSGEVGHFSTRWDFHKMDFSEVQEEKIEELQFV